MAHALLVGYAGYPYTPNRLTLHNGLANMAGALVDSGHDVEIIDYGTVSVMRRLFPRELHERAKPMAQKMMAAGGPPSEEAVEMIGAMARQLQAHQREEQGRIAAELAQRVSETQPDMVVFQVWDGDGFTGSVALAEAIRDEEPEIAVYASGPQAARFHEYFYRKTDVFDAVIHGEAEAVVPELARVVEGEKSLAELQGIAWKDGSKVRRAPRGVRMAMDDLPEPIYDESVYAAMAGDEKIKIARLDDSRGCPNKCYFCTHPTEEGDELRVASADQLAGRMERMINRYGLRVYHFAGSSTPGSLLHGVAREILDRDLDVVYSSFGHYGSSEPEHFELMTQSGLHSIFFGLESGCEEVLEKAVGPVKARNLGNAKRVNRMAQEAGIFTIASVIVPLPFDTEETLRESLEFVVDMGPDSVTMQFPGLLPGTPWFEDMERFGFEADPEQIMVEGLDYKLKLMFPPQFWEAPPYTLNGMSFEEYTRLTGKFAAGLEAQGILTGISHYNALISECAGIDPVKFRDLARLWCFTGDADAMAEMTAAANESIVAG
ncbi:MAG: B12-binding domain-containing radical SAM protein [Armatimonadota bacterium]